MTEIDPPPSTPGEPLSYQTAMQVGQTCVGLKVQTAARILGRRYDEALRPIGLTGWQYSLLMMLNRPTPLTVSGLADALAMDRTTITANLKPLERRSLISAAADPGDARVKRISLTEAGRALLGQALPHWRAVNDSILDRMSESERAAMRTAFEILLEVSPGAPDAALFLPSAAPKDRP